MAHLEARLEGRATFLSAPGPQHPPPPPACSGAALRREPARGMRSRARGRGGRSRAAAEAAPGFSGCPEYRGASNHSWPGTRRLRAPPRLCTETRRHAKNRTPKSVAPPGRLCRARSQEPQQQNGGRRTSGRPPPPQLSALSLRTRGLRLPAAAWALPLSSPGSTNQEHGRDGRGVRHSRPLPRSGWRRGRRGRWGRRWWWRPLPSSWAAVRRRGRCRGRLSPRWQENSWRLEGAAFRKPALGTKH